MSAPQLPAMGQQSGQAIVEAVMILVLLFGITFMAAQYFKSQEIFRTMITGPWVHMSGMLQNGIWAPPQVGAVNHPNSHGRHIAITGESAR